MRPYRARPQRRQSNGISRKSGMGCIACSGDSKYKCASCRAPYCSVACYKVHKTACIAPARAVIKPTTPAEGLLRTRSKRPYLQEREEVVYTATSEMLDRLSELDGVQTVLEILRRRDKRLRLDNEIARRKDDDDDDNNHEGNKDDDDGPPEAISLKPKPQSRPESLSSSGHVSAQIANTSSLMEHLADVIVQVCNAPTIEKKRHLMAGFLATDPDVDSFCDSILQLIGARNEQSQFIL